MKVKLSLYGPEGSRRFRRPDLNTIGTRRWSGYQQYAPAAFTPKKYSWYSFLLEAEGHMAAGRIVSMKNSNDPIENRTRDHPICRAVPQPTAPPRTPMIKWGLTNSPRTLPKFKTIYCFRISPSKAQC